MLLFGNKHVESYNVPDEYVYKPSEIAKFELPLRKRSINRIKLINLKEWTKLYWNCRWEKVASRIELNQYQSPKFSLADLLRSCIRSWPFELHRLDF